MKAGRMISSVWVALACVLTVNEEARANPINELVKGMLDTPATRATSLHQMEASLRPFIKYAVKTDKHLTAEEGEWLISVALTAFRTQLHEYLDLLVPVYRKYFTDDEIRALVRFQQSPVGQKSERVFPLIHREALEIGAKWGEKVGKNAVINALKARRGPELLGQNSQWHTWSLDALPAR